LVWNGIEMPFAVQTAVPIYCFQQLQGQ